MDSRQSDSNRKRKYRISSSVIGNTEEESWDCTVCTYKNSAEAFRCEMCQTRKGTSTRKPKLNPQIVEEQNLIARAIIKERQEEAGAGGTDSVGHRRKFQRHLSSSNGASTSSVKHSSALRPTFPRNSVDRTCPQQFEVFANGFSVVITEYLPKNSAASTPTGICKQAPSLSDSPALSNPASLGGLASLGNGTVKADHTFEVPLSNDAHSALADYSVLPKKEDVVEEELVKLQEQKEPDGTADVPFSPDVEDPLPEAPVESPSSSAASHDPVRPKRRKRRLRSELSAVNSSNIIRSLRSTSGSSTNSVASRSRHASRVARASLYRGNTSSPRPYMRRKVIPALLTSENVPDLPATLPLPPVEEKSLSAAVEVKPDAKGSTLTENPSVELSTPSS
ncbi:hypothetical protein Aperf_G00000102809 [Anoplocephala perfoliata]